MGQDLPLEALAAIPHRDFRPASSISTRQEQHAPGRHRLQRVDDQVQEHLGELPFVARHRLECRVEGGLDGDPMISRVECDQAEDPFEQTIQIERLHFRDRRLRKPEEVLHDPMDPVQLGVKDPEVALDLGSGRLRGVDLLLEEMEIQAQRVQRVLDFMGDAGGERPEGRELV